MPEPSEPKQNLELEGGGEEIEAQILKGIVFAGTVKKGGKVEYKSSDPERKIIILSESSPEPRPDIPYGVRIIEDIDPDNPKKGKLVGEIFFETKDDEAKELTETAKNLRRFAKTTETYDELARLYKEIERLYSPEALPEELREQYEKQVELMKRIGLVKDLESGELGIEGVDGKEYPIPTQEQINERMEANKELVEKKSEQGFKKLLLVPFGMKLSDLTDAYKASILRHNSEGRLFSTKKNPDDQSEQPVPLPLDKNKPLYVWDGYNDADVNGKLVYFPVEFSENHQGRTKQEILEEGEGGETPGWNIILIEDMPDIPRKTKGKVTGGRKQFEAGDTPNNYLKALKDSEKGGTYQNEDGMTPEDQLIYSIVHLEETDQVIDDWQGNGAVSYQLGAYFPASGSVPSAFWYRVNRQAYLGGYYPDYRLGNCGVRSAVRI